MFCIYIIYIYSLHIEREREKTKSASQFWLLLFVWHTHIQPESPTESKQARVLDMIDPDLDPFNRRHTDFYKDLIVVRSPNFQSLTKIHTLCGTHRKKHL